MTMKYDVIVVGGGPSGATAAEDLARSGHTVAMIDRDGRIKPCGGAIPPRLIADFWSTASISTNSFEIEPQPLGFSASPVPSQRSPAMRRAPTSTSAKS